MNQTFYNACNKWVSPKELFLLVFILVFAGSAFGQSPAMSGSPNSSPQGTMDPVSTTHRLVNHNPERGRDSKKIANSVVSILRQNKIALEDFGIQINNGREILYANQNHKPLIPASISKIYTAYSLLNHLGPAFKIQTELYFDGRNLYLKGGGDPGFVSESLWYLVNEFRREGITKIEGDVVIDDSLFDQVRFDPTRESTRVDRAYDSPVGAASFNWNAVNIFVKPEGSGEPARVILDPENRYFTLTNRTKSKKRIEKELVISVDQEKKVILVTGDVQIGAPEKPYYKNVADPNNWIGENLHSFLKQRNIEVNGKVRAGLVPASARLVGRFESKSLASMVADMNKFSNNFVAEMLTKLLGAHHPTSEKKSGFSIADGMKIINDDIVQIAKESGSKFVPTIENPSGFSRNNRVTAAAMNDLLFKAKSDFRIFPSLLESLPIAGLDGTMRRRMKNLDGAGFVRAKTGLLNGVIALAGYAGLDDGTVLHFTFLYNGPQDGERVRNAVDLILSDLLK